MIMVLGDFKIIIIFLFIGFGIHEKKKLSKIGTFYNQSSLAII
jgi:hypothetical protein